MAASELIQQNCLLQKKLNTENESYYGDLILYLRGKSIFKNDQVLEEKALEILQDIIDAQHMGQSAKDYFGQNPKEVADDLLASIPNSIGDFMKLALYGVGAYAIISLLVLVFSPSNTIDFGQFGIVGVYALVGALVILWFLGNNAYGKDKGQSKIVYGFLMALYIVIGLVITTFIDTPLKYTLSNSFVIGAIVVIAILVAISLYIDKRKNS